MVKPRPRPKPKPKPLKRKREKPEPLDISALVIPGDVSVFEIRQYYHTEKPDPDKDFKHGRFEVMMVSKGDKKWSKGLGMTLPEAIKNLKPMK